MQEFLNVAPSQSMQSIELPPVPSFTQKQFQQNYSQPNYQTQMPQQMQPQAPVMPQMPQFAQPAATFEAPMMPQMREMPAAVVPGIEEVAEPISPIPADPPLNTSVSARDMLIAKAKAFKETLSVAQKHAQPEQLSMNVDSEQQSLEEARRMAREVLSSPFTNQNLEVPAFIRKRQQIEAEK
jgi:cell division protein FtsZ